METYCRELSAAFDVSAPNLRAWATAFGQAMEDGLAGRASSLKMIPSFLGRPTGRECGRSLAIDFGGTNVRVLEVELDGRGGAEVLQLRRLPLVDPQGAYDHVHAGSTAEALFGFIAASVAALASKSTASVLGHTFSFPCVQEERSRAQLLRWTKEFQTSGVEGQEVSTLLQNALVSKGVSGLPCKAILNDTVGTLLTAAYACGLCGVGAICGTGHNTAYLEPRHPLTGEPMVVNLESGNFDGVTQTRFDRLLDAASEKPGQQRLEKMCGGHYLGELVRLIVLDAVEAGWLPPTEALKRPHFPGGAQLSRLLEDDGGLRAVAAVCAEDLGWSSLEAPQLRLVHQAADLVVRRSASLVAMSFSALIRHVDPELKHRHQIAVDGSLYERTPGYAQHLDATLQSLLGVGPGQVEVRLVKDGSGIGAAIAALMV